MSAQHTPRFLRVAPLVLVALMWCASGLAQVISQFDVYGATDGIALGPDGAMWFTDLQADRIGRIDTTGGVTTFSLPAGHSFPKGIALGPDGALWFTEEGVPARIGRITTAGALTEFALPNPVSRPYGIASGPDGNLWFTELLTNRIGRITTSGVITEFPVPTTGELTGITAGPDGNLWFAERTGNKIGRITTSGTVTEFDIPTANSHPTAVAAGPDGNIWFTESAVPKVGRISPTGDITEFPVSSGSAGVVAGNDGNLWFSGPGGFVADGNGWSRSFGVLRRVTTSGVVTEFSVPLYDPSELGIAVALDGALWMTDYINGFWGQIVRFALDTTPCVADTTTLCLNNGRFRVTADWRTRDGSTGQGHGVALTSDSGYFWFFNAANVEVVVKVLNGCGLNSRYWTFAAGLTDVNVILTVTDTQTGAIRTYTNPQGAPFQPIQDTAAFAACP
jgi:virginiamycin B lyase